MVGQTLEVTWLSFLGPTGFIVWCISWIMSILTLIVALFGKRKNYIVAVFSLLFLVLLFLSMVIGGFMSAVSMHTIDADQEFYRKQFERHTSISLPNKLEIVCKQDTVRILGIDGDHYDGHVRYRMQKHDLLSIRQQLVQNSSFVCVPDSSLSWLSVSPCNDGPWVKDSSFQYQGADNKESYLFFSEDNTELFFLMTY